MAARQNLSRHQQGIVKRYYEHQDTIVATRLSELVTELYLAEGPGQASRLWGRVRQALQKTDVDPKRIDTILENRDVSALATLVSEITAKK